MPTLPARAVTRRSIPSFARPSAGSPPPNKAIASPACPSFSSSAILAAPRPASSLNAGLEPELLAGLVYRDNNLVPTRTANLWFSRRTIFVEAGGKLPTEPARWTRLIRKLQPRTGVASQGQAPRAVLVCYDSENFTRAGAQESCHRSRAQSAHSPRRDVPSLRHQFAGLCALHQNGPASVLHRIRPQPHQRGSHPGLGRHHPDA